MRTIIFGLIPVLLLGAGASSAQMLTLNDEAPPVLVSAVWLKDHAGDAGLRIVDARPSVQDYLAAHVPGAIHLPAASLRGPAAGMPARYHPAKLAAPILTRAGVGDGQRIVLYADGEHVLEATLVAWALERLGHRDTMILDGGLQAFAAAAKTTQSLPAVPPARLRPKSGPKALIPLEELKPLIGKPGVVLVDVRPEAAYLGETKTWIRNGHIPGAVNLDWHLLTVPGDPHRFRPVAELRKLFEARGITPEHEVVVYCGTGREATLPYLVLSRVLGYPDVRLYEGSWTEWSSQRDPLVETGKPDAPPAAPAAPNPELLGRMYDLRTVETVTGPVVSLDRVAPAQGRRGGIHLTLKTDAGDLAVHLGPSWFIDEKAFTVDEGEKISVTGSRVCFDGVPFLIAAEVRAGDRKLVLRDDQGLPLWRGQGRGRW